MPPKDRLESPYIFLPVRGGATGTLEFYANGEDFVRQGFVSMDGWSIQFDHVYITLADITAYQTDPPYDPTTAASISGDVTVGIDGSYTIDLAEGGADAPRILVGTISDVSVGHYNLIDEGKIVADGDPRKIMGDELLMEAHGQEKPLSLIPHQIPHH